MSDAVDFSKGAVERARFQVSLILKQERLPNNGHLIPEQGRQCLVNAFDALDSVVRDVKECLPLCVLLGPELGNALTGVTQHVAQLKNAMARRPFIKADAKDLAFEIQAFSRRLADLSRLKAEFEARMKELHPQIERPLRLTPSSFEQTRHWLKTLVKARLIERGQEGTMAVFKEILDLLGEGQQLAEGLGEGWFASCEAPLGAVNGALGPLRIFAREGGNPAFLSRDLLVIDNNLRSLCKGMRGAHQPTHLSRKKYLDKLNKVRDGNAPVEEDDEFEHSMGGRMAAIYGFSRPQRARELLRPELD